MAMSGSAGGYLEAFAQQDFEASDPTISGDKTPKNMIETKHCYGLPYGENVVHLGGEAYCELISVNEARSSPRRNLYAGTKTRS
jgi:hypothetical protein